MTIRVLIVDDQEVVRSGLAALIETQADMAVVGTAANGGEAVEMTGDLSPDVVLMDVRMEEMDGIEATRHIVDAQPDGPRVLILTTFDLDEYVYDALGAGASGFLLKDAKSETLFEAVRVVAAGEALLAPNITRRLINEFARRDLPCPHARQPQLADRAGDRGAAAGRRRTLQLGDRRETVCLRRDGQDPRKPNPQQTRLA